MQSIKISNAVQIHLNNTILKFYMYLKVKSFKKSNLKNFTCLDILFHIAVG